MLTFNVTFETITPESAKHGDVESRGFICENATLREAIDALGCGTGGCELSEYPVTNPRWVTMYETSEDYGTGETENRSLHFPDDMTVASKIRVARLLGCYGIPA